MTQKKGGAVNLSTVNIGKSIAKVKGKGATAADNGGVYAFNAEEGGNCVVCVGIVALTAAEGEQKASQCLLLALHQCYELFSRHTLFLLFVHALLLCQYLLGEHTATYEVAHEEGDADSYQCRASNDEKFVLHAGEEIEQH